MENKLFIFEFEAFDQWYKIWDVIVILNNHIWSSLIHIIVEVILFIYCKFIFHIFLQIKNFK
jgi:hypothetical protein